MPYQLLRQVTVDCAVVIYGFCHFCLFFFWADLVQTKTIQFAVDFLLSFLLHCYTISNKSRRFVPLSPRLCCWSYARASGWSQRTGGGGSGEEEEGPASALELWLKDWASRGSDKPVTLRPGVEAEEVGCCFDLCDVISFFWLNYNIMQTTCYSSAVFFFFFKIW